MEGHGLIDLTQDRDWLCALVKVVMNLQVHKMLGISLQAENWLASQGAFFFL